VSVVAGVTVRVVPSPLSFITGFTVKTFVGAVVCEYIKACMVPEKGSGVAYSSSVGPHPPEKPQYATVLAVMANAFAFVKTEVISPLSAKNSAVMPLILGVPPEFCLADANPHCDP
jgi:hypothetical protein